MVSLISVNPKWLWLFMVLGGAIASLGWIVALYLFLLYVDARGDTIWKSDS